MLPVGLTADLAPTHRADLHRVHPTARTVAQLLVGACSCDLIRKRKADPIEDERELRARFQRARVPRSEVIKALERHRRGPFPRHEPVSGWPEALASFVAEHSRNAGPTLYLLEFTPLRASGQRQPAPIVRSLDEVRRHPERWMVEGTPAIVS